MTHHHYPHPPSHEDDAVNTDSDVLSN